MNKLKFTVLILALPLLMSYASSATAKAVTWMDLADVAYRRTFSPQLQSFYEKPIFSKEIAALSNQKVQITGYVIPVDTYGDKYFLSSRPNSSCFFCGKGQMHEVMELKLKNLPANYKMDEFLTFEGTLQTHTDTYQNFPFSLDNATQVK